MGEHIYKLKEEFGSEFDKFKDDVMFNNIVSGLQIGMSPYTAIAYLLGHYKSLFCEYGKVREQLDRAKIIIGSEVF